MKISTSNLVWELNLMNTSVLSWRQQNPMNNEALILDFTITNIRKVIYVRLLEKYDGNKDLEILYAPLTSMRVRGRNLQ